MNRLALFTAASLLALAPMACNQSAYSTSNNSTTTAGLAIEPSSREIVVGETVTFVARTHDTYGRSAKVEWSSTAGDLKREEDGRIARVKFDEVGTYTVKASLMIDNVAVQSDMVEVRVKPIR